MSRLEFPDNPRGVKVLSRMAVLVGAVCVASSSTGFAQQQDGRRIYQEQLRVRLDEQDPERDRIGLDAGGWVTFGFFNFDDSLGEKHTLRQFDIRGWASVNIDGIHKFYVRGMTGWDDWNSGDNTDPLHGDEDIDPRIERAWYELNLGRWLSGGVPGVRPPVDVRMKVGRAFADIGTALVLSMPLDMIQFDVEVGNWAFMGMLGKTVSWIPNIDSSAHIVEHQKRCFYGFELAYNGLDNHRPFAYFLTNLDHSSPHPDTPGQDYDYTSRYLGVGSEGRIFLPRLRYQAEIVGEWGRSYGHETVSGQDDICAMAADVMLEYLFDTKTSPKVMFEYLYATGDSDRLACSSSTVGGNRAGTKDRAFNAFGFRDTGIAFAPRLSNLHTYILGASCFPLEGDSLFDKMELGSKVFFYHKDESGGPISDTVANNRDQWVGWEWDVFCDWRISSDLVWTIRYGAFRPGTAFEDQECRQFLYTGLTYSF